MLSKAVEEAIDDYASAVESAILTDCAYELWSSNHNEVSRDAAANEAASARSFLVDVIEDYVRDETEGYTIEDYVRDEMEGP